MPNEFGGTPAEVINTLNKLDIHTRSEHLPGAFKVLADLLNKKGSDVYRKVAPNLGRGSEIWEKYKDECGEDLDVLVEKYGK